MTAYGQDDRIGREGPKKEDRMTAVGQDDLVRRTRAKGNYVPGLIARGQRG